MGRWLGPRRAGGCTRPVPAPTEGSREVRLHCRSGPRDAFAHEASGGIAAETAAGLGQDAHPSPRVKARIFWTARPGVAAIAPILVEPPMDEEGSEVREMLRL